MLNQQYIYDKIPIEYRFFFDIVTPEIPIQYQPCVDNLIKAILLLAPYTHFNKKVTLVISGISYEYQFEQFHLAYQITQSSLPHNIENAIFYYLDHVKELSQPAQINLFLQQLIHTFMNISDKTLVQKIVQFIYPETKLEKYL